MNEKSDPRELPTRKHSVAMDESVWQSLRRFATSTGLTSNLALHVLLNCYDAYGDPDSTARSIKSYEPGPAKIRSLIADDGTFERLCDLTKKLRLTYNVTVAVLLDCFREHAGPIRVEGAGLRIPCPIDSPCAPDAPSAGPVDDRHAAPTRLKAGMSAVRQTPEAPIPDRTRSEKASLLQALIAEEKSKTHIFRRSAALLSVFAPDA